MIDLVSLSTRHIDEIVELHMECLPSRFHGSPGRKLMGAYYATIAINDGATGLVAVKDGQVIGYVCGIWDRSKLNLNLLRMHFGKLLFWAFVHGIVDPKVIVDFLRRLSLRSSVPLPIGLEYELRPIVVIKEERGSGVANELIKALIKDARHREFDRIHLFVDEDNLAAQSCYLKAGFSEVKELRNREKNRLTFERSTKDIL